MAKDKVIDIQLRLIDTMSKSIEASIEAMKNASAAESRLSNEREKLEKQTKEMAEQEKKLARATKESAKAAKDSEISFTALGVGLTSTVLGFVALSSAINQFENAARFIIQSGGSFEQSLANTRAILQPTAEDFSALSREAFELGRTSVFTASEAADAFTELGKLGFETSQILASGNSVLDLAAAANIGMAQSAEIAATVLNQFGLTAGDTAMVVDTMAKAFNVSALDVDGLALSMKYVGPVAKSSNISLSETTAALGALADNGIQAQTAGTSLRRILGELANENSKASEAIREVNPAAQTMTEKFEALRKIGMDNTTAIELFGIEAQSAAIVLAESVPKIQDYSDKLEWAEGKAKGYAKAVADIQMDTFEGAIKRTSSELEALGIQLFEAFKPQIMEGVEDFLELVQDISVWADENQDKLHEWGNTARAVFGGVMDLARELAPAIQTVADALSALAPRADLDPVRNYADAMSKAIRSQKAAAEAQARVSDYASRSIESGKAIADLENNTNDMLQYRKEAFEAYKVIVKEIEDLESMKRMKGSLSDEDEKRLKTYKELAPALELSRKEYINLADAQKRLADQAIASRKAAGAQAVAGKVKGGEIVDPIGLGTSSGADPKKKVKDAYQAAIDSERKYFQELSKREQRRDYIGAPDIFGAQGLDTTVNTGFDSSAQAAFEAGASARIEAERKFAEEIERVRKEVYGEDPIARENREYSEKLALLNQYNLDTEELTRQHNEKLLQMDMELKAARLGVAANFAGALSDLLNATAGENKKQLEIAKHLAALEVAMNTAVAVSKVWSQTGIFGTIAQAAPIIAGAAQIATIEGLHFKDGGIAPNSGIVPGGTGKYGDNVPVYATRGEMFLNSSDQMSLFQMIKNGGNGSGVVNNFTFSPTYSSDVSILDMRRHFREFQRFNNAATGDPANARAQRALL